MSWGYIGDPDLVLQDNNSFKVDVIAALANDDARSTVSTYLDSASSDGLCQRQAVPCAAPRGFKLPEYWPHAPQLWFCRAEFKFETAGVSGKREMFAHVVEALSYESLKMVKDLMLAPPLYQPYQVLKARLLLATQLTPIQMAEKLMKTANLGDRWPSQLLASLLEFCPPGEENTALFRASFLMRLPAAIRAHLDGLEHRDLKDLAAKADRHWCNGNPASVVAAVADSEQLEEDLEEPVAAVSHNRGGFQQKQRGVAQGGCGAGKGSARGGGKGGGQTGQQTTYKVCWKHAKYGTATTRCVDQATCEFSKLGN